MAEFAYLRLLRFLVEQGGELSFDPQVHGADLYEWIAEQTGMSRETQVPGTMNVLMRKKFVVTDGSRGHTPRMIKVVKTPRVFKVDVPATTNHKMDLTELRELADAHDALAQSVVSFNPAQAQSYRDIANGVRMALTWFRQRM